MHEWALADAIARAVEDEIRGNGRVRRVRVILGELQNVDASVMRQYLEMMLQEVAPGVELVLEEEPAEFECNACGYRWSLREASLSEEEREAIHFVPEAVHAYLRCPRCGSRDFRVVRGRGIRLVLEG